MHTSLVGLKPRGCFCTFAQPGVPDHAKTSMAPTVERLGKRLRAGHAAVSHKGCAVAIVVDSLQVSCSNWWTAFKYVVATCGGQLSNDTAGQPQLQKVLQPDSEGSVGLVSFIWLAHQIPGSQISGASGYYSQIVKCQVNSILVIHIPKSLERKISQAHCQTEPRVSGH